MALVAKKRQDRLAKEAAAAEEKAQKAAERQRVTDTFQEEDDVSGGEGGRRLTQQTRPTRKASKKAIEELAGLTVKEFRDRFECDCKTVEEEGG